MPDNDYPTYDEFGHRQENPLKDIPVHRQEVQKLVEDLLDFEAKTHPQNPDPGVKEQNPEPGEKELYSIMALALVEKLVEKLAGWAMDHRAGMILNGATVYPWPEDDQEAPLQANDHRHEAMGSAYLRNEAPSDPQRDRHIVAEIMKWAVLLPRTLRNELLEAIRAVDFGETRPLLLPVKGQRKKAYTSWQLRLNAVEHVYFLRGTGETKKAAFHQVGEAYGVSSDTVDSWNRSSSGLLHHFGAAALKVNQELAKKIGALFQRLQMQLDKSVWDNIRIKIFLLEYGPEALSQNGQRYKMVNRDDSA
ncbi:MAG: hypothetical protein V3U99_04315 [Alphaproteobacteria bacterium]